MYKNGQINFRQKLSIDTMFILILVIILCIPMSYIDKSKKAKGENRYLAKSPKILVNKKINYNFFSDLDNYFNDRFLLRKEFITWNARIKYVLNQKYTYSKRCTVYKPKNFIYSGSAFGLAKITKNKDEVLKTYADNISKFNEFCKQNNIKLYVLVVPRKIDFFDYPIADKRKYEQDQADEVIDYIKKNTSVNIIYPYQEMVEANKETPVYFKTDHHWTKKGAYVSYQELIKEIKKDFKDVSILKEEELEKYYDNRVSEHWDSEFNNGQTYGKARLSKKNAKKFLDTPYLYYKNPKSKDLKFTSKNKKELLFDLSEFDAKQDDQFYYPYGKYKTLVIANSFANNLVEFLPYSFKYTVRFYDNYRYMRFKTYEEAIKNFKPDIIVININSHYAYSLLNLYDNKYSKIEGEK